MLSECLHYQGKAGFLIEFLKWYFSKYWQVQTRPVFAQTVTYDWLNEFCNLYIAGIVSIFSRHGLRIEVHHRNQLNKSIR